MVKDLHVRFGTGKDVLSAYWGYLSDGGLVIPDQGVDVGEPVALKVHVESSKTRYSLVGKVVKRDSAARQAVVKFSPGEPHDMLLTEALAETDNVPARRHRRYRVELAGTVRDSRTEIGPAATTLVDLSEHGCCLRLDDGGFEVGSPVVVVAGSFQVPGDVVWARHNERGVAFAQHGDEIRTQIREFLSRQR